MSLVQSIFECLIDVASHHTVVDIRLGALAIGVRLDDCPCGVAYRFKDETGLSDARSSDIHSLCGRPADSILSLITSEIGLERSVGLAAANSLVASMITNRRPGSAHFADGDVIAAGVIKNGDRIAMIGYFQPLVEKIGDRCKLEIYELDTSMAPFLRDSSDAPQGLKRCDVALITSTTIINGTVDGLLEAAGNCREVVMLGPSTPMVAEAYTKTPVTLLSGALAIDDEIMEAVSRGHSMHHLLSFMRKVNFRLSTQY